MRVVGCSGGVQRLIPSCWMLASSRSCSVCSNISSTRGVSLPLSSTSCTDAARGVGVRVAGWSGRQNATLAVPKYWGWVAVREGWPFRTGPQPILHWSVSCCWLRSRGHASISDSTGSASGQPTGSGWKVPEPLPGPPQPADGAVCRDKPRRALAQTPASLNSSLQNSPQRGCNTAPLARLHPHPQGCILVVCCTPAGPMRFP